MNRFHVLLASVVVGAAAVLLAGQDASQAAALFQQGLLLERAQGNVDQALVLYERVVADYPKDTQVLPQVLSHLAQIYDSRNDPRAIRMWSRLASDFGATPYADAARRRLADAQTPGPFRSRSIDLSGASSDFFASARDGKTVAFRKHVATGDEIWLHDVDTGRDRRLLQEAGRVVQNVGWSPDGRRLAVVTSPAGTQPGEYAGWDLRLAEAQGNRTATVATAETGRILSEWSPDGRWVFAQIGVSSGPKVDGGEIRLIDAETLQSRKLAGPTSWISVGGALWSRNSRQFIYQTGNAVGDLSFWIASVDAADVRPWTPSFDPGSGRIHLATGMTQTWTIDNRVLLRQEDAAGSSLYLIPASGGAAEKSCTTIPGRFECLRAMTPDGRLRLAEDTIAKRLMLLDLGKPDAPRRLTTGFASETSPNLSPDGRLVTFAANPDGTWALYALPIDRAPGNAVRIDSLGTEDFTAMAWTPSGRLIGDLYTEDEDVYRINVDATGHPFGPADRLTQDSQWNDSPAVSPASDRIAYNSEHGIAVMTADGAAERRVLTASTTGAPQWRSADELIFQRTPQGGNLSALSVLNVDTGAVQPLVDVPPAAQLMWQYAPSRNEIFYVAFANVGPLSRSPGTKQVLHAKSIQTGADRVVAELPDLAPTHPGFLVSPDGTQVAYSRWAGSGSDRHLELHLMTIDGQADRVLAPRAGPYDWSPDGRLLLHGGDQLTVTDVRSGQSWAIEQASDTDTVEWDDARWAPNGTFIVLTRDGWHDEYRAFDGLTYDAVVKAMDAKH